MSTPAFFCLPPEIAYINILSRLRLSDRLNLALASKATADHVFGNGFLWTTVDLSNIETGELYITEFHPPRATRSTDETVNHLFRTCLRGAGLASVRSVIMDDTHITDRAVETVLTQCPNLEHISFKRCHQMKFADLWDVLVRLRDSEASLSLRTMHSFNENPRFQYYLTPQRLADFCEILTDLCPSHNIELDFFYCRGCGEFAGDQCDPCVGCGKKEKLCRECDTYNCHKCHKRHKRPFSSEILRRCKDCANAHVGPTFPNLAYSTILLLPPLQQSHLLVLNRNPQIICADHDCQIHDPFPCDV
ncbi:hypothetical protein BC938DRAFT_480330 [Jimgerdemannia flammicorona]|uniref:F-box domain-containing protein n=1 Tax=Jimgerdemannia flammicorona TaxID=994334 RepID=A0A433QIR3_9FUNG|nr:hypothetical protein BC938DRAFT_480330 [Jimgerdemannia flammicorona]